MIESINLDGTGRQMIANDSVLPYALAVDEQSEKNSLKQFKSSFTVICNSINAVSCLYHLAMKTTPGRWQLKICDHRKF